MGNVWNIIKNFCMEEDGISTVEVILILVVLVALVLIFKNEMTDIVEDVFDAITDKIKKIT